LVAAFSCFMDIYVTVVGVFCAFSCRFMQGTLKCDFREKNVLNYRFIVSTCESNQDHETPHTRYIFTSDFFDFFGDLFY
jgi:hypothetical protein